MQERDAQLAVPSRAYGQYAVLFFLLLTAVRLAILASGAVDLSGDEAHYWEWSRRLDWCYYSKPPGVAFLIWLGTRLFGATELGVRFMAPVLSLLSSLVMYGLGSRLHGPKVGLAAAVLLQIVPLFSAFGIGMTPDAPLIFFWVLSLYLLHRAWSEGAVRDWLLLACSVGLGLLSKYAIAFLCVPAALLLIATPQGRRRLRTPWPYLSLVLSLLFFLPVIFWNSRHGWVMFRHDLAHAEVARGWHLVPGDFLEFVGGQLGVITPVMAVLIVYLLIKRRRQEPFCFWLTIPILAGFLLKSLQGGIQANWAMVGWLAGLIPAADFFVNRYRTLTKNQKHWANAAVVMSAAVTLFLHAPFITLNIPWPEKINPLKKLIGWRQIGARVSELAAEMESPLFVLSPHYMVASEMAFYMKGHPTVYCIDLGRRMNQYDLWPGFEDRVGDNAVFVSGGAMPDDLKAAFDRVERSPVQAHDRFGRVIKTVNAYRCYGFKGWTPKPVTHY